MDFKKLLDDYMKQLDCTATVSYTHLDVYKRQDSRSIVPLRLQKVRKLQSQEVFLSNFSVYTYLQPV